MLITQLNINRLPLTLHWRYAGGQLSSQHLQQIIFGSSLTLLIERWKLSLNICTFIGHWQWADEFQIPAQTANAESLAAISFRQCTSASNDT